MDNHAQDDIAQSLSQPPTETQPAGADPPPEPERFDDETREQVAKLADNYVIPPKTPYRSEAARLQSMVKKLQGLNTGDTLQLDLNNQNRHSKTFILLGF
jgi:hypothetical protein